MSPEAVAERSGLAPGEVAAIERGGAGPPEIDTLIRLATALAVAPEELLGGIDWTPGDGGPGAFRID